MQDGNATVRITDEKPSVSIRAAVKLSFQKTHAHLLTVMVATVVWGAGPHTLSTVLAGQIESGLELMFASDRSAPR